MNKNNNNIYSVEGDIFEKFFLWAITIGFLGGFVTAVSSLMLHIITHEYIFQIICVISFIIFLFSLVLGLMSNVGMEEI